MAPSVASSIKTVPKVESAAVVRSERDAQRSAENFYAAPGVEAFGNTGGVGIGEFFSGSGDDGAKLSGVVEEHFCGAGALSAFALDSAVDLVFGEEPQVDPSPL